MNTKNLSALVALLCSLLSIGLLLAQPVSNTGISAPTISEPSPLIVGKGEPAKNPTTLSIIVDHRKVLGWISGTGDFTGREVKISADGKDSTVIVQEGNAFTWHYKVEKATTATFAVDTMTQSATLEPLVASEPSAFFVLDRSVYRPGQELKFAGFLRKVDDRGEFIPLAGEKVSVTLVSERKKTTATTIKLTSDDLGRIEGSYKWTEGDVIDDYTLSVTGYKGTAKVGLAEYRKSKIKLKISGKRFDDKLTLTFDALDFLEKPVPGSKVSFNAQVVQNSGKQTNWTLNGPDFAYHSKLWLPVPDKDDLSEEEALLVEADHTYMPTVAFGGKVVVSQINQEISLDSGTGEFTMDIKKEWLGGRFCVDVQGVLIDANGREQRATHHEPLNEGKPRLTLNLPKRVFTANEAITLQTAAVDEKGQALRGKSTVVAMKLTPGQVSYITPPEYLGEFGFNPSVINPRRYGYGYGYRGYNPMPTAIPRVMATAVGFVGDKAELTLPEPGAYKLVVVTHTEDGKSITDEIGCIVRKADELHGLHLTTDKREYTAGESLVAEIRSRFADAHILVTLRDSQGVRLWKPLQLAGQTTKLSLRLPEDTRYACDLVIQYVEGNGKVHVADQVIRVVPAHRFISIKTEHKDQVVPGETVKLSLSVNRAEPVDLVVSVYDQSLLGITSNKQTDIRNFYFADERIVLERDRDLLRRRLGSITLAAAVEQTEAIIKERGKSTAPRDVQTVAALRSACDSARSGNIQGMYVATLLQVAGLNVQYRQNPNYGDGYYSRVEWSKAGNTRLLDMVEHRETGQWFLAYRFFNDTLVMTSSHPNYVNNPAYLNGFYPGYGYDQYGGGLGFSARGDGAFSSNSYALSASANASFSVEGQGSISHMAQPGPIAIAPMDMPGGGDNSTAIRRDFSDAAFWNAHVRTDAKGKASVEFKLPDSLTNWRVVVTAVTKDLQVGTTSSHFRTFKPVMVWPMLPRNFTQGDIVSIFGTVHNHTDKSQNIKTTLKVDNGDIIDCPPTVEIIVPAKGNAPVYWTYRAAQTGFTQILMSAECADGNDASLKRLPVFDSSVWETTSKSGFCKGDVKFTVPAGIDLATTSVDVSIAPSLAADMAETLDYLVDYPHGCVEQTMSRFLPAIKVAQILAKFRIKNPALEAKLPKCVDMGIKRLLELQQPDGGWGWNGNSQTHEMMTPYALYGLMEAEKAGYKIPNEQALQRGLTRLRQFIDNMGEAQVADRLYCIFVYSHREKLQEPWWTFIEEQSGRRKLSDYATAMALEMAMKAGKERLAEKLAASLRERAVRSSGTAHWETARFSRWGDDPNEITAAVLKAFVAYNLKDDMVPESLAYFAQNKRGNRWNSTKDTAMILYAMCDYLAKQEDNPGGEKMATLKLNNSLRKQTLRLEDGLTRKVAFTAAELKPGENILRFDEASPGMMFRLNLKYRQAGSAIKAQANGLNVQRVFWLLNPKTGAQTQLKDGDTVPRGSYVISRVTATSNLADQMRYVLVENPKPGSCEIQPAEDRRFQQDSTAHVLREDKEVGVFWHHEQTGGNLQDTCVIRCEMSGEFVVAPAHAELMYKPEVRGHSGTFRLKVGNEPKLAAK